MTVYYVLIQNSYNTHLNFMVNDWKIIFYFFYFVNIIV